MDLVRRLKIEPGIKLVIELIGDRRVVIPEPKSWTDYFSGRMKGVYGTTRQEV